MYSLCIFLLSKLFSIFVFCYGLFYIRDFPPMSGDPSLFMYISKRGLNNRLEAWRGESRSLVHRGFHCRVIWLETSNISIFSSFLLGRSASQRINDTANFLSLLNVQYKVNISQLSKWLSQNSASLGLRIQILLIYPLSSL